MKAAVLGLDGEKKGEVTIEKSVSEPIRQDLITRAVLSERSARRQPYAPDKLAGKRTSAHYHGRRAKVRHSMMNREMARMPRIHTTATLYFTARFAPQTRKGRVAHPPRADRVFHEKINRKEWRKALHSAIAASFDKNFVAKRSHILDGIKSFPLVAEDEIETVRKTKYLKQILEAFGLGKELETAKEKDRLGPLVVISEDKGILKAGRNIAGLEVVNVKDLSVEDFAPGTHAGRLVVWAKSAIERM